jgi:hypothetical protein
MAPKHPKRPRDFSQAAKLVVDIASGQASEPPLIQDSPATEFARSGGLKGGKARALALSPERRSAIARAAAKQRWKAPKGK